MRNSKLDGSALFLSWKQDPLHLLAT
jgi:hypothetical protein